MRILVTGASGMLGSTIVGQWRERHDVFATGGAAFTAPASWQYRAFDLAGDDYRALTDWAQPDAIVHGAAVTAVDACEGNPERTLDINGRSVERLRRAAPSARLLYISSDAVLGVHAGAAAEDTTPAPLNVYGHSKLLGETLVDGGLAVRTTVVGWNVDPRKQSFVEWIVRTLARNEPITLFDDALFTPIAAADLARELEVLLTAQQSGVLHVTGHEGASKHAFGLALARQLGLDVGLIRAGKIADVRFTAPRATDQRLAVTKYETTLGRSLPTVAETVETLVGSKP